MQWTRGFITRWQSEGGAIEPDPRLVFAAMALGMIVGALLM